MLNDTVRYMQHLRDCDITLHDFAWPCSCGMEKALDRLTARDEKLRSIRGDIRNWIDGRDSKEYFIFKSVLLPRWANALDEGIGDDNGD